MSMPRSEYPRPQFVRDDWLCLNGQWQFEIDLSDTGKERGLVTAELAGEITVPFCPESELSGVGETDFLNAVWYRREIEVPAEWKGKRTLLHFQAVDYDATVWVNGEEVYRHRGGWAGFTVDLGGKVAAGETFTLVLRARDNTRNNQPGGKQCVLHGNVGCMYTRTTGIWQTVWMEPVDDLHMKRPRITPDLANKRFKIDVPISNNRRGVRLEATLLWDGKEIAAAMVAASLDFAPSLDLVVPDDELHLWGPGEGNLYDIKLKLIDAAKNVLDEATCYAGLRSVAIDGMAVTINGKSVFQRQVLDQGYYADGIMTAPTDEALKADVDISMAAGFNSARLHQKVFEERFLYHADKAGYLVWGEFGDWGINLGDPPASMTTQWLEVIQRDYNHPSIIGWCPLNETHHFIDDTVQTLDDVTKGMFLATKAMDTTRPVLDTSGYAHRVYETDIYDCHDYDPDGQVLIGHHAKLGEGDAFVNSDPKRPSCVPYAGQPYFVSEFGGIWWNPKAAADEVSWGYGERPKDVEEFFTRFKGLCDALLDNPNMFGYCYTQLTDVFQEQNGVVFFDRTEKFDMARLHAIQSRKAAIEN